MPQLREDGLSSQDSLEHYFSQLLGESSGGPAKGSSPIASSPDETLTSKPDRLSLRESRFLKRLAGAQLRKSLVAPGAVAGDSTALWLGLRVGALLIAVPDKQVVSVVRNGLNDALQDSRAEGTFVSSPSPDVMTIATKREVVDDVSQPEPIAGRAAELLALLEQDEDRLGSSDVASHVEPQTDMHTDVYLLNPPLNSPVSSQREDEQSVKHLVYLGLCGPQQDRANLASCALCVDSIEGAFELNLSVVTALSPVVTESLPRWVREGLVGRCGSIRLGEALDEPVLVDVQQMQRSRLARQLKLEH